MQPRTHRRTLQFESLESKLLLSNVHAHTAAVSHLAFRAQDIAPDAIPPTGPMPSTATIQDFQNLDSGLHLENMLSEIAYLETTRSDVQAFASSVMSSNQALDNLGYMVAQANNILGPPGLLGADQATFESALPALKGTNSDQAYLTNLAQADAQIITRAQQLLASTNNTQIQQFASLATTIAQQHLAQAQTLLSNLGMSSAPVTNTGSTSPPVTNDATYVQTQYEGDQFEWLMSQVAALVSKRPNIQSYGNKLVYDHYHGTQEAMTVASSLGQALQPGISGEDQTAARQILAAVNTSRFDRTYLTDMVQANAMSVNQSQTILGITQNPNVRQLAESDAPSDSLHRLGAIALLHHLG